MAQPDRNSQKENKSRGGDPNFNWRGVILFAIAFALIGLRSPLSRRHLRQRRGCALQSLPRAAGKQADRDRQKLSRSELVVEEGRPTQTLRGAYIPPWWSVLPLRCRFHFGPRFISITTPTYRKRLAAAGIQPAIRTESNVLAQAVIGFVPIALFLLVLYFLFRQQIRMAGKGALNFGKIEGANAGARQK